MGTNEFESKLRTQLAIQKVKSEDIEFIMSQIHCSEIDGNLKIMNNDVYELLSQRGLKDHFIKACYTLGIKFTHSNEPER